MVLAGLKDSLHMLDGSTGGEYLTIVLQLLRFTTGPPKPWLNPHDFGDSDSNGGSGETMPTRQRPPTSTTMVTTTPSTRMEWWTRTTTGATSCTTLLYSAGFMIAALLKLSAKALRP